MTDTDAQWRPPFLSEDTNCKCPKCGAKGGAVQVIAKDRYADGDGVEAYCFECHADLWVTATLVIESSDPEIAE